MKNRISLIFYYKKGNRYGINALSGVLEINSELEKSVRIFYPEDQKSLFKLLKELSSERESKIFVLFSFFTPQKFKYYKMAKEIKNAYPEVSIIGGGPHPSGAPGETLSNGFDFVFRGEAEKSFENFIYAVLNKKDYNEIRGISFIRRGEYFSDLKGEKIKLDNYPPFSLKYEKFGPIEITRGCPYVCYYCQTPQLFGAKVRHRSIENILKYVEILKKSGMRDMRFISPNALSYGSHDGKTINYDAIENLLKEMKKLLKDKGRIFFGTFPSEVRPEHINEQTLELLKKYTDNKRLVIGAQTGSDSLLKKIHRGHSTEHVRTAVKLSLKYGYGIDVDFIFGLPEETERDISGSVEFMEELISYGARIHAHTFMPLPQTPFYKKPAGKIPEKVKKFVNKYLPKGKIFGDWRKQEEIAGLLQSNNSS